MVGNSGSVELENVVVSDDNGTPTDASDDFNPQAVLEGAFNVGDTDDDGLLAPGEQWICTAMQRADETGEQSNLGAVTATPVGGGPTVSADAPAYWTVVRDDHDDDDDDHDDRDDDRDDDDHDRDDRDDDDSEHRKNRSEKKSKHRRYRRGRDHHDS